MSRLQVVKTLPKVFFPLRCGFEGARLPIFPCEDSIGPVAAVREQSALYRVSFACVHRVLREVCVRFRYLLPFPSLSHRFDHEIREDRAPKRLTPPSSGISSFWLPWIPHRFGIFPHKFENPQI